MTPDLRRRAKAIFHEALDRPVDERGAFVSDATDGDVALASAVHDLLGAHSRAGEFLGRPTLGAEAQAALGHDADGARVGDERPGTRIGRYKLLERVGEGGFGVVWMAEQQEPVRRRVALKVIKLGMDTKAVVARFEAERQALALMEHESIARVFDAGATDSGRPYFVMELVNGVPITRFCDDNGLSTRERLRIFVTVCRAVQHAHQKGVIHRDIKPGNVLVTLHDGRPVPKVIDFGIAKATSARLTEATMFTEFRQVIGTPEYMAPEQAEMSGLDIDTRADVYSLGVLLYELLTGEKPFDLAMLREKTWDEVVRTIREVEPKKPSTRVSTCTQERRAEVSRLRSSADLPKQLSGDLDWIVMKALEKDRTRRYETALALAEDVERHMQDLPVLAGPPSRTYQLSKFARRHRLALAAATVVFLALVIGVWTATWGLVEARDQRAVADSKAKAATAELKTRTRVAQFLADMLRGAGPSVAQGRDATILREIVARTKKSIDTELKGDGASSGEDEVRAALLDVLGVVSREIGDLDDSIRLHRESVSIRRRLYPEGHVDLHVSEIDLAVALSARGLIAEAEEHAREAQRILDALPDATPAQRATSQNDLAAVLVAANKFDEAESHFRESVRIEREAGLDVVDERLAALDNLGELERLRGNATQARLLMTESLERVTKALGPDHPRTLTAENNLAALISDAGQLTEARERLTSVLERSRRVNGTRNVITGLALENAGLVSYRLHDDVRALKEFDEAIAIYRDVSKGDWDALARALTRRGRVLLSQGKKKLAQEAIEEGLAMYARLPTGARPEEAEALADRASTRQEKHDDAGAESDLRRAVEIAERVDLHSHQSGTLRNMLGGLFLSLRRHKEAAVEFTQAYAVLRVLPNADPVETATVSGNLATALLGAGDLAEAETIARESLEQRRHLESPVPSKRDALLWLSEIVGRRGRPDEALPYLVEAMGYDVAAAGSNAKDVAALHRGYSLRGFYMTKYEWARDQALLAVEMESKLATRDVMSFSQTVAMYETYESLLGQARHALDRVRECVEIARRNPKDAMTIASQEMLLATALVDVARESNDVAAAREAQELARSALAARAKELPADEWRMRFGRSILAAGRSEEALSDTSLDAATRRAHLESARDDLERDLVPLVGSPTTTGGQMPVPGYQLRLPSAIEPLARLYAALEVLDPGQGHAATAERWRRTAVEVRQRPPE